jgi:polyisoprenoid-binding protein YceI
MIDSLSTPRFPLPSRNPHHGTPLSSQYCGARQSQIAFFAQTEMHDCCDLAPAGRFFTEASLTINRNRLTLSDMRTTFLSLALLVLFPALTRAQAPVFEITRVSSSIRFDVQASVDIHGKFDKWDASLTFASPDETTGVLEITIQAASVDTGSGMKNGKLKGKDFFDVEHNPVITFKSTKVVKTGPETYEVDGDFAIRGVSNPEKLKLTVSGNGTGSGDIIGNMVFNRKDYGMNKGIPFIKIADHVEVDFHLKAKRVSGPQLDLN